MGGCECVSESACVGVDVYIGAMYSIHPLVTCTPADSPQSNGAIEAILSQKVYGELALLMSLVRNVRVKSLSFSTDRSGHLKLFRKHVSRTAAGKGRAVLEGVGFDTAQITACFTAHPMDEEESIQTGLVKWSGGQGLQPPMWKILLEAMSYANVAQQYIQGLEADLGFPEGTLSAPCDMFLAVTVTEH